MFFCLVKGNLRSWLLDENCYDQCAVVYNHGMQVAIAQCTTHEMKVVTEREVSRYDYRIAVIHENGVKNFTFKKILNLFFTHQKLITMTSS